jgi:hypothetical protein
MLLSNNAKLVEVLNNLISKYGINRQVKEYLKEKFTNKNLLSSYATKILTKRLPLETLDINNDKELLVLYVFTEGLQEALKLTDRDGELIGLETEIIQLGVKDYFTITECQQFSKLVYQEEKQKGYPYVFEHMLQISDSHYSGIISAQDLAKLDSTNDIIYNFNTQRNAKIDVFGIKRINVDKKKIQEISDNMLSGQQFADEIKINVLRNGDDDIEFISTDGIVGTLKINSGEMNIFDGFHRKTANQLVLLKNPEIQFNWKLAITNFTEQKAQDYMVQINKQTPMKKEYIKTLDKSKLENLVVDLMIDNPIFELSDKIKITDKELKFGGYTKKEILSLAISEIYGDILTTKIQAQKIAKWLVDFFNYISQWFDKDNYATHKYMFYSYISLSRKVFGKEKWQNIIDSTISSFDFSNSNNEITFLSHLSGNLNKVTKEKLYNVFKEVEE